MLNSESRVRWWVPDLILLLKCPWPKDCAKCSRHVRLPHDQRLTFILQDCCVSQRRVPGVCFYYSVAEELVKLPTIQGEALGCRVLQIMTPVAWGGSIRWRGGQGQDGGRNEDRNEGRGEGRD